ncbi:MAG: hypothetical protein WBE18_05400 [Gammaproteobacteria bacterium]
MKIECKRIISYVTKEDLGDSSPWLKVNEQYVVLALVLTPKKGIGVYIQTEHYNEPCFMTLDGFEILTQNIPSNWITEIDENKVVTLLPKSWAYNDFFEDMENQKPEAIKLFNEEVELIYREEGMI